MDIYEDEYEKECVISFLNDLKSVLERHHADIAPFGGDEMGIAFTLNPECPGFDYFIFWGGFKSASQNIDNFLND